MASQSPKFILRGVNFTHNFLGYYTIKTAIFGYGEVAIKIAPVIAFMYGMSKHLK